MVKYFKTFGSKCYILRDRENLGKFDSKSDEGIFLGYSTNSRAYRVFNKRTETVMESINVVIDDEEVERPSRKEENQLDSVDPAPTDIIKSSPNMSPVNLLLLPLRIPLPLIPKIRILLLIRLSDHG